MARASVGGQGMGNRQPPGAEEAPSACGGRAGGAGGMRVDPRVLAEAEHVLGNLFHRLRYCFQRMSAQNQGEVETAQQALGELEEIAALLLDYANPVEVQVKPLRVEAILQSLARALCIDLSWSRAEARAATVCADPACLAEAFRLMGSSLGRPSGARLRLAASGGRDDAGTEWLAIEGRGFERSAIGRGRGLLAWSVAQKFIAAHGGVLEEQLSGSALEWVLRLPLCEDGQ